MCKVSLQACASAFETSVQAHLKVQMYSSTLAVKLCSRSVASLTVKLCCRSVAASTLAAKLRVRSQRSLESTRSFDRTRSFAASVSKLRPTRMGQSFDNGHSEASSAVEVSSTLQTLLRAHSNLRCKRTRCKHTRSYAAKAKFHCERSYAARAKFYCERA